MDFDLYTGIISYNLVTAFMPPLWAEQKEVQQQHNNNNNNKRLLPKSNMRSVHCFICFRDGGSVQQDVIALTSLKEFVPLNTEGVLRQVGFQLEADVAVPEGFFFLNTKLAVARRKSRMGRSEPGPTSPQ